MDFLFELIVELLFEVPFEAAMESRRLKRGVKTVLFCLLGGVITAFMGFLTVCTFLEGNLTSTLFMSLITLGVLLTIVFGAIRGHKRNWKK